MQRSLAILTLALAVLALPGCAGQSAAKEEAAAATRDSLQVGRPAPKFSLPSQDGSAIGPQDFPGKWVVLYFYPKDFTGGCTIEAHNFQRDSAAYAQADAVILGVSVDTRESHEKFCAKEGLRFRLLADTDGAVSARYASLHSILGKKLSARNTYLIDPQGNIARVFTGVKPAGHSEEVLAALAELRKPKAP